VSFVIIASLSIRDLRKDVQTESIQSVDNSTSIPKPNFREIPPRCRQDLSGVWKRIRAENYEEFIAAQGGGFVQRKLAASMALVHTITMDASLTLFRLQEKGGPIDTDVQYVVDGPEVPTVFLNKQFLDHVFWSTDEALTIRKLLMPEQDYEIIGRRWIELEEEKGKTRKVLRAEIIYHNLKTEKQVKACNVFEYVGPSPNARPVSVVVTEPSIAEIKIVSPSVVQEQVTSLNSSIPNLGGTWKRIRTHNYEAFAAAGGAGFLQRKLAATMPMTHILTFDKSGGAVCRLQEEGGPLVTDSTLTIGDPEFSPVQINGKSLLQRIFWLDDVLVLQRRFVDNDDTELIFTRSLDPESPPDRPQILVKAVNRNLKTHRETVAMAWFLRTGDSPNAPPPIDSLAIKRIEAAQMTDGSSTADPGTSAITSTPHEVEDIDSEDDETALARMHTRTSVQYQNFKNRLSRATQHLDMTPRFTVAQLPATSANIVLQEHQAMLARVQPFSGVWTLAAHQQSHQQEYSAIMDNILLAPILRIMVSINISGEIIVKFLESNAKGKLCRDSVFSLDGDFVVNERDRKVFKSRVFLEDSNPKDPRLVTYEVCVADQKEFVFQRSLENNGKMLCLTVTVRNLGSGKQEDLFHLNFVKSS
jgi:hypothetical protein